MIQEVKEVSITEVLKEREIPYTILNQAISEGHVLSRKGREHGNGNLRLYLDKDSLDELLRDQSKIRGVGQRAFANDISPLPYRVEESGKGRYARVIANAKKLPHEEQLRLLREYRETGDQVIFTKLVNANIRLITLVLRKYNLLEFVTERYLWDEVLSSAVYAIYDAAQHYDFKRRTPENEMPTFSGVCVGYLRSHLNQDILEAYKKREKQIGNDEEKYDDFFNNIPTKEKAITSHQRHELTKLINEELERMNVPEDMREIMAHHYGLEGREKLSLREIKKRRGISHQTVKNHEDALLKRLKNSKRLHTAFLSLEEKEC